MMGPLCCLVAASPFGNHLARTGQVGEGVNPALDADLTIARTRHGFKDPLYLPSRASSRSSFAIAMTGEFCRLC